MKEQMNFLSYVIYRSSYPTFIKEIAKTQHYLAFLKYPEEIRKYIWTTNIVENFNSLIEKIRIRQGGFFPPKEIEINLILQIQRLHQKRWQRPHPLFKNSSYELNQLFNLTFDKE
jgi:transposase-like protein